MSSQIDLLLQENVNRVRQRIADACQRAGRQADEVQLVAVTKYASFETVQALATTGIRTLGESRPQRLWELVGQVDPDVQWHLIGHLQRNKVARTLPLVCLIHSVDSERLLRAIDKEAQRLATPMHCLLEVNISGEEAKHGWAPEEVPRALELAGRCHSIRVQGLMAMAALEGGLDRAALDFKNLRELRDSLLANCPDGISLAELSMGMSRDFEVAIEQGATMVRVGSALFEGI